MPPIKPPTPLRLRVAPHLVQDLGLNLYTSLPKVLVEFVANAHDADAKGVNVEMDFDRIQLERNRLRAQVKYEQDQCKGNQSKLAKVRPLSQRTLPGDLRITIKDNGCGMSRIDLQEKFLVAGRRRRDETGATGKSAGGRLLMGRKGVGKLAGFGVAHRVTVTSRPHGQKNATRITLDYATIRKSPSTDEFPIPEEVIKGGGGLEPGGTEITLSDLLYQPLGSQEQTISSDLADHFWLVGKGDFAITLNGAAVKPRPVVYSYAWPTPSVAAEQLAEATCSTEDGQTFKYSYRLRFREKSLPGDERGVRVYAHGRLAAAPSLLGVPTGSHGFKYTDYLDGIVVADFLDEQEDDYIRTDRQALRWETTLLAPLRQQLGEAITEACNEYYKKRQKDAEAEATVDPFTQSLVVNAKMPKHRQKAVLKVAAVLWQAMDAKDDPVPYQQQVKMFVENWRQGDILRSLRELANQPLPDLARLLHEATELTARELADFANYIDGRLSAIESLKRIVRDVNFAAKKNESELQKLFEQNPWLIDPTFTQFLSANQTVDVMLDKLTKELKIGPHAPAKPPTASDRPDLVFLIGSMGLKRVIVVELKAANVKLDLTHLTQLKGYMHAAEKWLRRAGEDIKVEGILIGSRDPNSSNEQVELLEREIAKNLTDRSPERVMDILEVLTQTEKAHRELLTINDKAQQAAS